MDEFILNVHPCAKFNSLSKRHLIRFEPNVNQIQVVMAINGCNLYGFNYTFSIQQKTIFITK